MSVEKIGEWKQKTGKEKTKLKQTLDREYGRKGCTGKPSYKNKKFCTEWKKVKDSDNSDSKQKLAKRKEERFNRLSKISKKDEQKYKKKLDKCGTDANCVAKVLDDIKHKRYHPVYGWLRY